MLIKPHKNEPETQLFKSSGSWTVPPGPVETVVIGWGSSGMRCERADCPHNHVGGGSFGGVCPCGRTGAGGGGAINATSW